MKKSLWSWIFHCQSTWDTHFFQSFSNSCYHYCWLISWCRRENSFMGTWRGHNWIILAVINGSENHSLHCYETDFHNFWIKVVLEGRRMPRVVEKCVALPPQAVGAPLTQLQATSLTWTMLKQYSMAIPFGLPRCRFLRGAVNQDWHFKMLLENIKALLLLVFFFPTSKTCAEIFFI